MHLKDGINDSTIYLQKMSDREYQELLDRILKGADYLANPLIKEEDYKRGIKLYDDLCAHARRLRWGNDNAQIYRNTTEVR